MEEEQPSHAASAWLFLRGIGVIYLIAFASLLVQVDGLLGSRGIAPAGAYLETVAAQVGPSRFTLVPTLLWLDASDTALHLVCAGGVVAAALIVVDLMPAAALLLAWALYLSLVSVGQDFLSFQWDTLLLETGFLAIFLAPWSTRPARHRRAEPPKVVRLLLWWLLFRLMFSSGVVKLASGDPAWRRLDALRFHYETQPLPTYVGWAVHPLPLWFHELCALGMFAIELLVPILVFAPRRARHAAVVPLVGLQLVIALTGNYTFFNLLAIALAVFLLDDRALGPLARWFEPRPRRPEEAPARGCPRPVALAVVVLVGILSFTPLAALARWRVREPDAFLAITRALTPFRIVNGYGLFAIMTTRRIEIVIEGSADGDRWAAYEFRYKPGDLDRGLAFIAPHQPRLDWQMWFAALGDCQDSPWLEGLFARLLAGSPPVLGLLANDPFPGRRPRLLRAIAYDYHFTDWAERARTGHFWRREPLGMFCSPMSLGQGASP